MPLAYGLNFTKKPNSKPGGLKPSKPLAKSAFADESDEDGDASTPAKNAKGQGPTAIEEESIGFFDEISPSLTHPEKAQKERNSDTKRPVVGQKMEGPPSRAKTSKSSTTFYGDLTSQASALKIAREAEELDPSIYTYEPYHATANARKRNEQKEQDAKSAEPPKARYMESLLAAAEVRKRDQLRAKERLLQKDREAEGDEFADKEKFVTEAYKRQQEEIAKAEEEERKREEAERKKRKGMAGFFKGMLDAEERKHEELEKMDIVKDAKTADIGEIAQEKKQAKEMNASGAGVLVNDEGDVVDKRQLLSAGLNVSKSTVQKAASARSTENERRNQQGAGGYRPGGDDRRGNARDAQRERQTKLIEQQLEESLKRKADEEELDREKLGESLKKSKKTDEQVSSAKERYLARKREREAAAAASGKKE